MIGDTDIVRRQLVQSDPSNAFDYEYPARSGYAERGIRHEEAPGWPGSTAQLIRTPVFRDLVTGWWEYQRLLRGTPEERRGLLAGHPAHIYADWTGVTTRVSRGGLPALELVAALVEAAPAEADLSLVGCGPLEDLVHKHGDYLVREVAYLANRNLRFARALSDVWLARGVLTADAEQQLSLWITVSGTAGS